MELLKTIRPNFSRRKFFLSGSIILASVAALSKLIRVKTKEEAPNAKFLTEDGRLVEVSITHLPSRKVKASTNEVKHWIWKEHPSHGKS